MSVSLVIGGGITGLTTAYYLGKKGQKTILIEPGDLGGVIKTKSLNGFTLEEGPNVVALKPALRELCEDIGFSDQIVSPKTAKFKQFVWNEGSPSAVPKNPAALIKSDLFSWIDKVLLPLRFFRKKLSTYNCDDLSVAEFVQPIIGAKAVYTLLDPALKGIFGGNVDFLSARCLFPELWQAAESEFTIKQYLKKRGKQSREIAVFKGGMIKLIEAIESALPDLVSIEKDKVTEVSSVGGSFIVNTEGGKKISADSVYCATSGDTTARYMEELSPDLGTKLKELSYASIAAVHVSISKDDLWMLDSFGMLFPEKTPDNLLGIMFNSELFPHLAPKGRHLLTICFGGAFKEDFIGHGDEWFAGAAGRVLSSYLGIGDFELLNVSRWKKAIPQLNLGHIKTIQKMNELEDNFPGLYFLGNDRGGIGVPDRVQLARDAAKNERSNAWMQRSVV